MPNDLSEVGQLDSEDDTERYGRSPDQDDSTAGTAPQLTGSDGDTPGLLGHVQAHWPTTVNGQPLASISALESNASTQPNARQNSDYDDSLAHPGDADILWIGNPFHPRLRREWSQKEGRDWPTDPVTGRRYDVAHIVAKADGGKDHVDNIRPMHPADHQAEHIANGDYPRWARRPGIARAFGGRVARSIEPFAMISGLLGLISGRTRTDSFDNFMSDMEGIPSTEDHDQALGILQRALNPNWKPGDPLSA